jgi:adenosylcobinamide-GDP ribazoletransferase
VKRLAAALNFLTVWGHLSAKPNAEIVGRSAGFFPFVGLALGLLLALSNYIFVSRTPSKILNLLLVALWIATTGAQHLLGLKKTFDALGNEATSGDPRRGEIFGLTAVMLVILLKSAAMDSMDELLTLSLLVTPVLGRWALVIFLYGYHSRFDETARLIADRVTITPVLVATVATLALIIYFLGRKGLWIALTISLFSLLTRRLLNRRHSELSVSHLGTAIELSEALSLLLLASL